MKEEFLLASVCLETSAPDPITRLPPHSNSFKLNLDAACFSETKKASLGMVVCDHLGSIHLCAMKKVDNIESLLYGEIKAILFDLEIAQNNFFLFLMIEEVFAFLTFDEIQ